MKESQSEMPPPSIYMAASNGRYERLKNRYPDLFDDGYFCYTLDCGRSDVEDRIPCKICKEKHWKIQWPKEWRL